MFEWLRKQFSGGVPVSNTCGLADNSVKLLAADFEPLNRLKPGLDRRVLRYILDNEGEDVLLELGGVTGGGAAIKLVCCEKSYADTRGSTRKAFFDGVASNDPKLFLRIARVYEAASRLEKRDLRCPLFGGGLEWMEILLQEATGWRKYVWPVKCSPPAAGIDVFEAMLVLENHPPDLLVRSALTQDTTRYGFGSEEKMFTCLKGFGDSLLKYPQAVHQAFGEKDFNNRMTALRILGESGIPCETYAERIVELAVSSSKKVRETAEPLLHGMREVSLPLVRTKASAGSNEERGYAVRLLWKLGGEENREFLAKRMEEEKSAKVLEIMRGLLSAPGTATDDAKPVSFNLAPVPDVEVNAPLDDETKKAFTLCVETCCHEGRKRFKEWAAQTKNPRQVDEPGDVDGRTMDKALALLQNMTPRDLPAGRFFTTSHWVQWQSKPTLRFLEGTNVKLIHAVRFCVLLCGVHDRNGRQNLGWGFESLLLHYRRHHSPAFDLRELAAVLKSAGIDDRVLGWELMNAWRHPPLWVEDEAVWPYFAERLDLLEEVFGLKPAVHEVQSYYTSSLRKHAFEILGLLPQLPPQFVPLLWEIALGSSKTERPMAQKSLDQVAGKEGKIMAALGSGQQDVRSVAAEWLSAIGCKEAVPALCAALQKEKSEIAKGAMMLALEALGVPVNQFLDRGGLLKEAEKGLQKGVPDDLAWFSFQTLPAVHWEDTGEAVPHDVVKWFIVQAHRLKTPEAGPRLRRYCASLVSREREALGQFVLESWIAQDTLPKYTVEQASPLAEQQAKQLAPYYKDMTHDQLYQGALNGLLKQCKGSAIDQKGILAVAGACCGNQAAASVSRYLKKWYGIRASQSKSLIQMLAWVDHPTAAQLLLSVGHRFRTKGIREEADKYACLLAERRGWSRDELGDHTIPTAGFDENGRMEIDYGIRTFTATLQKDLSVELVNQKGSPIQSLPDAGKDEDEAAVKETKRVFSAARKELKSVLQLQAERLYEAMCTQRSWVFADWDTYLNHHPVMRFLVQRLVWIAVKEGTPSRTYRPLEDGSLTDPEDNEIPIDKEAKVFVAHDCNTDAPTRQAWARHLDDYKVEPLFQQFGKGTYALPGGRRQETEIKEFEGHLLEAFKLRGKATKLGYTRGPAEDGGWFFTYRKNFPSLEMEAVIEFTGNGLPEENRTVALRNLHFERAKDPQGFGYEPIGIGLGEIPPVLLAECWNDIRIIAAEGKGFDPAWEKKVEY